MFHTLLPDEDDTMLELSVDTIVIPTAVVAAILVRPIVGLSRMQ